MSDEYVDMFIDESRENLEFLEAGLMRLEGQSGGDSLDTVRELFRFAHNLKGMAATVGQSGITRLAHRMEDLLDLFRNEVAEPSSGAVDELLRATDALGAMLDQVPSGSVPEAPGGLLTALEARIASIEELDAAPPAAEPGEPSPVRGPAADPGFPPAGAARFVVSLVPGAALPGARSAIVIKAIENTGDIVGITPARDLILAGKTQAFTVDAVVPDPEALAGKLSGLTDVAEVAIEGTAADTTPPGPDPAATQPLASPARNEAGRPPALRPESAAGNGRQTVRVEVERLDDLMNLVGELVIGRGQLERQMREIGDRALGDVVTGLSRTISELQSAVARARMVTLEGTFSRLQRLARDTSRELGKDVAFSVQGGETELDRSMIDKVADPLVHLLRNALDHGIEASEARTARGKPAQGSITLVARTEGNQVIISIADDGDGIDTDRVVTKALAKGLITPDQAGQMDEAAKQHLIFLPGFSTREQASAVSGRGVGMDVVRSSVGELGGSVDVESRPGHGSTFRIRLPLSLAVLDVLLVVIGGQVWAIPLQHVEETISVGPADLGGVLGSPVVTLRGETIGVIHGNRVIGQGPAPSTPFHAVVFRHQTHRWALSVDSFLEQAEVVVKPSPDEVSDVAHVAGATILGDGRVSLILDLAAIVTNLTRGDLRHAS